MKVISILMSAVFLSRVTRDLLVRITPAKLIVRILILKISLSKIATTTTTTT